MFTDGCGSSRGVDAGDLPATFHAAESMHDVAVGAQLTNSPLVRDAARSAGKSIASGASGASNVEKFYNATLAKLVSVAYVHDFERFQYPLWDGESTYHDRQF
jgi:hypothetical protein